MYLLFPTKDTARNTQTSKHPKIWNVPHGCQSCVQYGAVKFSDNRWYFQSTWAHSLGTFAQLRKMTISCVTCVCPSVRPHGTDRLPLGGLSWNLIFEYFSKIRRENSSFVNIWQELQVLYMKTNVHFWSYLAQFFLEWENFQTKCVEQIKTHMRSSITFFRKSCRGKILYSRTDHRRQYGAWTFHGRYLRLQTQTQNLKYLLLFHCNKGCTNAPECYVTRTSPMLFIM